MKKVVIIGAGPAGLTAGYELLKRSSDYEVVILEESGAIGGISRTVRHHGNRMDIGGHRFFTKDDEVSQMWRELMPSQGKPSYDDKVLGRSMPLSEGGPDPETEDRVMLVRNRVSRIYYRKKFFSYPIKMSLETIFNLGLFTTFVSGLSYVGAVIHRKPETSLENFYINRFGQKLYSMFFEGYTEKLWGRHPREISADWGAQRVKGLSILAVLKDIVTKVLPGGGHDAKHVETSLIEEFYYPKYGPGQFWETVADEVRRMGGRIVMNCAAREFQVEGDRITGVDCVQDGTSVHYDGDVFMSSMPLKDLAAGMPSMPEEIAGIAAGLPYRDFVTVGLLLKQLSLKNKTALKTLNNLVPDCWIYVQDAGVKLGRIQIFNNWSPYMVAKPEETVWIGLEYFCTEGDDAWKMTQEEWVEKGRNELVRMGVIAETDQILDAHVEKVKKAYPAYFDTYQDIDRLIEYLNGLDNLYCIGRNGQHRYNNMDHSMATAMEAVRHLLAPEEHSKAAVWQVNTEKTYHEEKQE